MRSSCYHGCMPTILNTAADGSLTIPTELCRAAGLGPGAELIAHVSAGRILLEPGRQSLGERLSALARELPDEVVQQLPTDGAAQHDHYLYGTAKRPE